MRELVSWCRSLRQYRRWAGGACGCSGAVQRMAEPVSQETAGPARVVVDRKAMGNRHESPILHPSPTPAAALPRAGSPLVLKLRLTNALDPVKVALRRRRFLLAHSLLLAVGHGAGRRRVNGTRRAVSRAICVSARQPRVDWKACRTISGPPYHLSNCELESRRKSRPSPWDVRATRWPFALWKSCEDFADRLNSVNFKVRTAGLLRRSGVPLADAGDFVVRHGHSDLTLTLHGGFLASFFQATW